MKTLFIVVMKKFFRMLSCIKILFIMLTDYKKSVYIRLVLPNYKQIFYNVTKISYCEKFAFVIINYGFFPHCETTCVVLGPGF